MTDHRDDVFDADTRAEDVRTNDGRERGLALGMELELQQLRHSGAYNRRLTEAAAREVLLLNARDPDARTRSIIYH